MVDYQLVDLLRLWQEHKYEEIVDILEHEHAGLTALFVVSGAQHYDPALRLGVESCNRVTNMLMERRRLLFGGE